MTDGGHFIGGFNAEFKPHGEGAEFAGDGSKVVSGQWRDGLLHGRGKFNHISGDRYEGNFVAGLRNGLGAYTWANGNMFEGE